MISLAVALIAVTASGANRFGLSEPPARPDGTVRVATYNMLNFFDHADDPSLQGKYDDFGDNPGPTSEARCAELAKVIRQLDADVLALEEVESLEALQWFNAKFLQGMGYDYAASEEVGYYRGIEQSVLSRFPITGIRVWPDADLSHVTRKGQGWAAAPSGTGKVTFQRSPLSVDIKMPGGYELTLFIVHHKAGRDTNWHREAEALKIVELVAAMASEDPDRNIMVLGDFNAAPWDRSVRVYLDGGLFDTMGYRSTNVEYDADAPLWKTHESDRVIDYILVNGAAAGEYVPGSGFVLGTLTPPSSYDWRTDPKPAGYAADHYPVAIDIVPIEGQGASVVASPWPRGAADSALAGQPKATASSSGGGGSGKAVPADGAPYLASKRSKVFHDASCGNAQKISDKNRTGFATVDDAAASGRRPAKCCHPE
jgi:endonuclease/exonuclease/phosphatase family metal-dependent hydrolase